MAAKQNTEATPFFGNNLFKHVNNLNLQTREGDLQSEFPAVVSKSFRHCGCITSAATKNPIRF